MTVPESLRDMAIDSHKLMVEADEACKGHAAIRNAAFARMRDEYGATPNEISQLTRIPERTVRNTLIRITLKGKKNRDDPGKQRQGHSTGE